MDFDVWLEKYCVEHDISRVTQGRIRGQMHAAWEAGFKQGVEDIKVVVTQAKKERL